MGAASSRWTGGGMSLQLLLWNLIFMHWLLPCVFCCCGPCWQKVFQNLRQVWDHRTKLTWTASSFKCRSFLSTRLKVFSYLQASFCFIQLQRVRWIVCWSTCCTHWGSIVHGQRFPPIDKLTSSFFVSNRESFWASCVSLNLAAFSLNARFEDLRFNCHRLSLTHR